MAKALLTALLLVCELFSFDTSDACASGFISQDDIQTALDMSNNMDGYNREQCIFPEINFFGCNGSITAWTIGARWITGGDRNYFPYLQIWRRAATNTYALVNSTELFVPGERSAGRYVFNDTVEPPLQFQDGDILGIFQPRGINSHFRLHGVSGDTNPQSYHVLTGLNVFEPPLDTFVTTADVVMTENNRPLLSVEIRIDCSPLCSPTNGTVSITTDTSGTMTASYSCTQGYKLMGNVSRVCQPDGQWSGVEPLCKVVDCGSLRHPGNGTVVTVMGTTFGSHAQYRCNEGFNLMGPDTRTCQASGSWSEREPVCQVVDCGHLPNPINGTVVTVMGTTFGSHAQYRCNEGFNLTGPDTRTCQASGSWSEREPVCQVVDCGHLPNPINGAVITNGTTFKSVAKYNCSENFQLVGEQSRTCQASGVWSGDEPVCEVDCGVLSSPDNGNVRVRTTIIDSVANYSCDTGHNLMGEGNRTCQADGMWSGEEPVCQAVDCGLLSAPENGNIVLPGTTFKFMAEYSCDEGYVLAGNENRTCQANGSWSSQSPLCEAIDCGRLEPPTNGSITFTRTTFQSVARYDCDQGYVLEGRGARTCQADGSWSGQEPMCSAAETQEPSPQSGKQNIAGLAAGVAGGVVGGALLLIIGAIVVVLLLQRQKCMKQKYDLQAPEYNLPNPLYGNIGDDSAHDERYSEVTGLNVIAPEGKKYENGVHHTDHELQRLSESVEESHVFDNPVYADSGPIAFCKSELYESVEVQRNALEWGIYVPTFEQRRTFSEMNSAEEDPYSLYASVSEHRKQVANPSAFFDEEDIYWIPASDPNELYAQFAKRKFREILRHQIRTAQRLGSGQFGTVEKGVWQSPGGPVDVAVKTLNDGASEQDRVKFLQEAAISGQFHHPNVIKLHGVVTVGEPTMIVLEFMSKGDLRTYLNEEKPCPGEACPPEMPKLCLEFCRQIASGMEYLSKKAFVHRDLAARNVLVSQRKTCKIADFGMARDLEDENYYISQGAGKIPVKWTAPEALNFKKYSTASDVWSFGAVMYEIWSLGHKPFEGYTTQQTLHCINEGYRLSPPPGCSKAIYSIMIRCWHPEASSRPTFADLQQVLSDTDNLLSWSEEDTKVHPQAVVLGAPLDAAKDLYPEVQGTYMY